MNIYKVRLTDQEIEKLMKHKLNDDKMRDLKHEDAINYMVRNSLRSVPLYDDFTNRIRSETVSALAPIWAENFLMNIANGYIIDPEEWMDELDDEIADNEVQILKEKRNPLIPKWMKEQHSISGIKKYTGKPCIVVGAGPSVREHNHIKQIADSGFKGVIISTDRMLKPLLDAGAGPENGFNLMVASVDGHRILIPKMYRDENGDPLKAEGVKGLVATTVAPQTVRNMKECGIDVKWFHGALDDFNKDDSITSWQNWMMGCPVIAAGGNVGATSWTLGMYLECNPIIFTGIDLGYTPDTRYEDTAYYDSFIAAGATAKDLVRLFVKGYNTDFGVEYYQDPVFVNYKKNLLQMIQFREEVECVVKKGQPGVYNVVTINATEGGALHGPYIKGMTLKEALNYGA